MNLSPEQLKVANWFLDERTDDAPLGWDGLLGAENVSVVRDDATHFTVALPIPTVGRITLLILSSGASVMLTWMECLDG